MQKNDLIKKNMVNFKITHALPYISKIKDNRIMKFGQFLEYDMKHFS